MIIDRVVLVLAALATVVGVFTGKRPQLVVLLGFAAGYAVTAFALPRWGFSLSLMDRLPQALTAAVTVMLAFAVAGWLLMEKLIARAPSLETPMTVLDAAVGGVTWFGAVAFLVFGALGAVALTEPDSLITTDRWGAPLRESGAYELAVRHGWVQTQESVEEAVNRADVRAGPKVRVAPVGEDPRLKATRESAAVKVMEEGGEPSPAEKPKPKQNARGRLPEGLTPPDLNVD